MAITIAEAREEARVLILRHPEGIGPTDLAKLLFAAHPDMVGPPGKLHGTFRGAVWNLDVTLPGVRKVSGKGFVMDGAAPPVSDAPHAATTEPKAKKSRAKPIKVTEAVKEELPLNGDIAGTGEDTVTAKPRNGKTGPMLNWEDQARAAGWAQPGELTAALQKLDAFVVTAANLRGMLNIAHDANIVEAVERLAADFARTSAEHNEAVSRCADLSIAFTRSDQEVKRLKSGGGVETIGARIKRLRIAAGLQQGELAEKVGLSRGRVSTAELSTSLRPDHVLVKWAEKQESKK